MNTTRARFRARRAGPRAAAGRPQLHDYRRASLNALWNVELGFRADNVLTFGLSLPPTMRTASPETIRAALRELSDKLNTAPGVQAASFSAGSMPLQGDSDVGFWREGQPQPAPQEVNSALEYIVEPGYLTAMGIPLKQGRFFTAEDKERAPSVVVIDDVLAHKYFPNEDPVGQRLYLSGEDAPAQIVGVVGHVNMWGIEEDAQHGLRAQIFAPFRQFGDNAMRRVAGGMNVVVRAEDAETTLFERLRRVVQSQHSQNVVYRPQTMNEIIAATLTDRRFSMILLDTFALAALLLASVGLYGVIAYLVSQRTHELGIRLALGAGRGDVLRLVLHQGMKMALGGVGLGLVAALGLTRLLTRLLYGARLLGDDYLRPDSQTRTAAHAGWRRNWSGIRIRTDAPVAKAAVWRQRNRPADVCGTTTIITNVHTDEAVVNDNEALPEIHQQLSQAELLPNKHLADAGYARLNSWSRANRSIAWN